MTDPDRAPQFLQEAAAAAAKQMEVVFLAVFAQGIREGMEAAAQYCNAVAVSTRTKSDVSPADIPAIATAEFLRDKIRECSLEVQDGPPTPTEEKE